MIQNGAAQTGFLPHYSTVMLLHWLPVVASIRFKSLMLAYNAKKTDHHPSTSKNCTASCPPPELPALLDQSLHQERDKDKEDMFLDSLLY